MDKLIYKLPFPSTALWKQAVFEERPSRTFALICEYESDSEENKLVLTLLFAQTEAIKATYYMACSLEFVQNAYDKVVDFGKTSWLEEVRNNVAEEQRPTRNLRHLGIYFDEGFAYEFICQEFRTDTALEPYDTAII